MKRLLNEFGIARFHDLRHFAVSSLVKNGVDILDVSDMVWHSTAAYHQESHYKKVGIDKKVKDCYNKSLLNSSGGNMAISARNQLVGIVSSTEHGAVNDEIELTLAGGAKLIAIVTSGSKDVLGLVPGKEAIALIKAPWVTLATEDCGLQFSARNQFAGEVSKITEGAVNATVHVKADAGFEIVAVITNESCEVLQLAEGIRVLALIKASSVLIATRT